MIQFYYSFSVIFSFLIYLKLKQFNLTESEKSALHVIIVVPFINIIILIMFSFKYIEFE